MVVQESRLLGLIVQLQHPALQHFDKALRDVFDRLADIHGFQTFQQFRGGAYLRTDPDGQSENKSLKIERDRLTLEVAHPNNTFDSYVQHEIREIIGALTTLLKIPVFILQNYCVRKLTPVPGSGDARVFITQTICQLSEDRFQSFGRPIHLVGLRLFFPQTPEHRHQFEVKIESYVREINTLFLENSAQFFEPIDPKEPATLLSNFRRTNEFIDSNIISFLQQFYPRGGEKK